MKCISFPICITALALTSACSTITKSTLLGAAIGFGTGGFIGSTLQDHEPDKSKSMAVGATAGAALGGLIGYYAGATAESKRQVDAHGQRKDQDEKLPFITRPEAKCEWIEKQNDGRTFIQGHYRCVIQKQSVWSE